VTQPSLKNVQLGDLLRQALQPLMTRERRRRLFAAWALIGAAAALSALLLRLLEEHRGWVVGGFWWVLLAATAAAAIGVRWWLQRQPLEARQAAHLVETAHPELSALLLTAVAQTPEGGRLGYMQEELVREALRRSDPRWAEVVSPRRLGLTGAAAGLAGGVVLYCAVTALLPDLPSFFDDEFGARVSPGHTEAERGTNVLVLARFDKKLPPGATLTVRRPGKAPLRVPMRRSLEDPVYAALTPALDGERVEYHVEYGSIRSPRYSIRVFEIPEVERIDARIEYPRQPSMLPRDITDTRHLTVVAGARITLSVHLNTTARDVSLIGDGPPTRLAVRSGSDSRVFWGVLMPDRTRRYQVLVRDGGGRSNKAPTRLVVEINPNQPPQISLAFPGKDLRVSPLEEVAVEAKVHDDVGVLAYGLTYRIAGQPEREVRLGGVTDSKKATAKLVAKGSIALEELKAVPNQLLTYHFWAEDLDATGKRRRAGSDLYFAEVRPFEERFREAASDGQGQGGGEGGESPAAQLAKTQKDVMNANWRLERDARGGRPREELAPDIETVIKAETSAKQTAETMRQRVGSPLGQAALGEAVSAMDEALLRLRVASTGNDPVGALVASLEAEQRAFAALLRLAERERQVSRGRGGGGGGGQSDMAELNNLELKQKDSRYETRSEAASARQQAGGKDRESLSRLQELARRQKALAERLREAQAALAAEKDLEDEEKRRRLKRLREEQQELLEELDRVAQGQSQAQQRGKPSAGEGEMERSRQEAAASSEALARGEVGKAVGASTRAARELDQARSQLEKQLATGYEQEMRELREQAQKVDEDQQKIGQALGANSGAQLPNPTEVRRLAGATSKQKGETQRLLEKVQSLSSEAETAAPLLSRKLYEGLRKAKLAEVENALDITGQLLERNLTDEARQTEQHARQAIGELRASVEDAAKGVLGDEAQALRQARNELEGLLAQAARERDPAGAPAPGQRPGEPGARDGQPGQPGQQPGREGQDRQAQAGAQPGQQGQPGQRGQQGQEGQQGQGQQGNGDDPNGRNGGGQRGFSQGEPGPADPTGEFGGSGPSGGSEGPITGEGFRGFSERLRDVEDLLPDTRLRNRVAQVRDRARAMRADYKNNGKRPVYKLFEQQVLNPLAELRDSVNEELARLEQDNKLVPIDKDPVPGQYSELVRRYWKRLSEGR
jgi:hypothetical protein